MVEILKPGLVNILNFKFSRDADVCRCRDFEVGAWSILCRRNLIIFCVWPCDMTRLSYFGKQNSTLGSVVPLAMFSFAASPLKTHSLNMYLMWFRGFIISILYRYLFSSTNFFFVEAWLLPSKRQHTAENDNAPSSDEQVSSSWYNNIFKININK